MKKLFLAVITGCLASLSQAGVVAADVNGDGTASAFFDANNGLYWITGTLFSKATFDDAKLSIKSLNDSSFEGMTTWDLPTLHQFNLLYATQGHEFNSKMVYGNLNFDHFYYWTKEDKNTNGERLAYTVNGNYIHWFIPMAIAGVIAVSAVPEPETYAMLLAGLGLIGLAKRRKKI